MQGSITWFSIANPPRLAYIAGPTGFFSWRHRLIKAPNRVRKGILINSLRGSMQSESMRGLSYLKHVMKPEHYQLFCVSVKEHGFQSFTPNLRRLVEFSSSSSFPSPLRWLARSICRQHAASDGKCIRPQSPLWSKYQPDGST